MNGWSDFKLKSSTEVGPYEVQLFPLIQLQILDPLEGLSVHDIQMSIRNATGTKPSLFVPEISFEILAKQQILKLREPGMLMLMTMLVLVLLMIMMLLLMMKLTLMMELLLPVVFQHLVFPRLFYLILERNCFFQQIVLTKVFFIISTILTLPFLLHFPHKSAMRCVEQVYEELERLMVFCVSHVSVGFSDGLC